VQFDLQVWVGTKLLLNELQNAAMTDQSCGFPVDEDTKTTNDLPDEGLAMRVDHPEMPITLLRSIAAVGYCPDLSKGKLKIPPVVEFTCVVN
jgi:hypothetical protein